MRVRSASRRLVLAGALAIGLLPAACATRVAPPATPVSPRFPEYPEPVVPATVEAPEAIRARHTAAWQRLQSGDVRGAAREFSDLLRAAPGFYPAQAGLGYARMADRDMAQAAERFETATAQDARYLPAWLGLVEARLALGRDADAITALEQVVALDPSRTEARARLDLLRFRQLPTLIEGGQRARREGRGDEARRLLTQALGLAPTSGVILRELALVELEGGDLTAAMPYARRATELDPNNPEAHAALAMVHEAGGNARAAMDAYGQAVALEARPEWVARLGALKEKADLAVIPAEFRAVPTAATVTRAQAAAYVGTRLETLITRAPPRTTQVATDVRDHWAAPWILPVTRAGIMEIQPNHTFQPGATLRRGDLAQVVARLLAIIPQRQMDLARWRSAKPRFADLPASHVVYPAAALAVASGAMETRTGTRFDPTAPATGPDLAAAVARLELIAGR